MIVRLLEEEETAFAEHSTILVSFANFPGGFLQQQRTDIFEADTNEDMMNKSLRFHHPYQER